VHLNTHRTFIAAYQVRLSAITAHYGLKLRDSAQYARLEIQRMKPIQQKKASHERVVPQRIDGSRALFGAGSVSWIIGAVAWVAAGFGLWRGMRAVTRARLLGVADEA